eukprot:1155393-Pelagomonas_calceolata.AAC.3
MDRHRRTSERVCTLQKYSAPIVYCHGLAWTVLTHMIKLVLHSVLRLLDVTELAFAPEGQAGQR